jgi:serine/threonine protein kinase
LGQEIEIMKDLNHEHIVQLLGSHYEDDVYHIYMEWMAGMLLI